MWFNIEISELNETLFFRIAQSQVTTKAGMGLFKERRPSLPAMSMKSPEVEVEVSSLDRDFVIKHQQEDGVDISVELEEDRRYQVLARLQPCADPSLYTVRLATNIPHFPQKTSCTAR